MDIERLHSLINDTTRIFRKGDPVEQRQTGNMQVTEFYGFPPVSEAPDSMRLIDMVFVEVGVDTAKAESRRAEIVALLNDWPEPLMLEGGPSYIHLGGVLGSQDAALQLMALGEVLRIWKMLTPMTLGATGEEARQMAGGGMLYAVGFTPEKVA